MKVHIFSEHIYIICLFIIFLQLKCNTVWLSQTAMTELFQITKQNISLHIKNLFMEGELAETSVVKYFLTIASDGKNYNTFITT